MCTFSASRCTFGHWMSCPPFCLDSPLLYRFRTGRIFSRFARHADQAFDGSPQRRCPDSSHQPANGSHTAQLTAQEASAYLR